jgi:hypothetical protein
VGGLHYQADQKGREEIRAVDSRLAGRRKGPQGVPGVLQDDEPSRGHAEGPADQGGIVMDATWTMIHASYEKGDYDVLKSYLL